MSLGENIRYYRKLRGFSQDKLSELTGITRPNITNLENNVSNPTVASLERIVQALDIEMFDLFKE